MSFDALFPAEAESALAERVRRPELIPEARIGAFAGFGAALRHMLPAAVTESTRALSPLLDAYGKAAAFGYGATKEDSIDRMDVNDLSPLLGRELKRLTPDPQTTGAAAQVVFSAGKVLGKASGYSVVGGLPGAIIGTGLDEGINETLRLTDKGVDLPTAAQAGAVHGTVMAANIALPVAGRTLTQTAAIALAGGPVSYIGENTVIKAILENADYREAAKDYDPFNPVGLTVATLVPFLFGAGAHALRAGKGARAADAAPPPRVTPEQVDAALTLNRARQVDAVSLAPKDDFAAQAAHADALESAARSLNAGQAVELDAALKLDPDKAAQAARLLREAAPQIEARAALHAADEAAVAPLRAAEEVGTTRAAESPDVAQARQIVAENPDLPIHTGATDAQGNAVALRAADLLAEIDDDIMRAASERRAFAAAIDCALRNPA